MRRHQIVQLLPGAGIGENNPAQAAAVQGSVVIKDLRAESLTKIFENGTPGRSQLPGKTVAVHNGNAAGDEISADC